MKRLIVAILVLAMCGVLFAQASPFSFYGSARTGFFFTQETFEKDSKTDTEGAVIDGKLYMWDTQFLQGNSRLGLDYKKDNLTGKVELGAFNSSGNLDLRLLYGKYDFDGWSLLAGKAADGTDMLSNQAFDNDMGLNGYGAIFGGRNPQIRFGFFDDALYFALIKGSYLADLDDQKGLDNVTAGFDIDGDGKVNDNDKDSKYYFDTMIPKINLGYKWDINDDMNLHFTGMFQTFNMNKDFTGKDQAIMSALVGITWDWKIIDGGKLRVHLNGGQNIANMGFKAPAGALFVEGEEISPFIPGSPAVPGVLTNPELPYDETTNPWVTPPVAEIPDVEAVYSEDELFDATTMGGYLTWTHDIGDKDGWSYVIGVGGSQTAIKDDKKTVAGVALDAQDDYAQLQIGGYLQVPYRCLGALTITPELGVLMDGKNKKDEDKGNKMYGGVQLRYDF